MIEKIGRIMLLAYLFSLGALLWLTGWTRIEEYAVLFYAEAATDLDQEISEMAAMPAEDFNSSLPIKEEQEEVVACAAEDLQFSERDVMILERIVEAEAGGEDDKGKLLVANVVLNRVRAMDFPDSIEDVVFQRNGEGYQFSPVGNGRYDSVSVSEETKAAVARALAGEDFSEGALYFAARRYADPLAMQWFDDHLTLLFQHGGHEFFK